ncbi:MAG TPA: nucleotide disphospho-sugar-binding domain-containing protein [Microlunatus sp.]
MEPFGVRRLTFLFASTPITAHTINLVPVATRLIDRGHRVLWYAASRFHDRISGVGAEPHGFTQAREFADLEAAYGGAGSLRAIAGLRQGFADQLVGDAARRVHDLEGLAAGQQIDAVLTDAMFVAARLWHERGGPVWASLGDGPRTYADVDTPPYGAGLLPMHGREGRRRNRVTTRILRELIWEPAIERLGAIRCELGLVQSGRSVLEEAMSPHLHLQACVPEFEYPRHDLPAQVRFVGALRPEPLAGRQLPPWWAEFLSDDRSAVLVSQGTLRPDLSELVLPTIAALAGTGHQVVVTTGAGSMADLRAGLGHGVPDWLRVARWIPYEDVLPHVDAFVTNGGYTGVTLALAHGVPLVQVGSSEEKAEIGARIAWSKVGVRLRWRPTRWRLRREVRRALDDPDIRAAVDGMQASLARHDAAGEAAAALEELARTQAAVT